MTRAKTKTKIKTAILYVCSNKDKQDIASSNDEKLMDRYAKQLKDNGYKDFTVSKRDVEQDMYSFAHYYGSTLTEHEGLLYPRQCIDWADNKRDVELNRICNLYNDLKKLSENYPESAEHFTEVLECIKKHCTEIGHKKLKITMFY